MLLAVAACGPDGQHGRVKGSLEGINQADVIAYVDDATFAAEGKAQTGDDDAAAGIVDSILVKRGGFTYDRAISEPTILTLLYPNFSTTSIVIEPGKTVKLKGDANRLGEIEVDGNEDNILLSEFRKRTAGQSDAEVQRQAATFIRTHATTLAAVALFRDVFASAQNIEANPAESLLAELKKAQPKSSLVKSWTEQLEPLLATAPGKPLPAFTANDIDGKSVSSSAYEGKNLLIVFCAQWDVSFYNLKRNARELISNLDDGQLSLLFVSFDTKKDALASATNMDPLPGKVIFDGKGLDSPLFKRLGVRYISGSLLVGKDGKIKARDIPCEQWKSRIPSLL